MQPNLNKISKNWLKMADVYRLFVNDDSSNLDFSSLSALEMYEYESSGKGDLSIGIFTVPGGKFNGYAVGKKIMDITIKMWIKDIKNGLLTIEELYSDSRYPGWWLDRVLKKVKK